MSCPSPRVSRAVLKYALAGGTITNVLHIRSQEEPDPPELASIGLQLISWWDVTMKQLFSGDLSLVAVEVTAVNSNPMMQVISADGLPIAGTVGFGSMSANVSTVVSLRTNYIGRSYRGRVFQPPPVESGVADNMVSENTATAYREGWEALQAYLGTANRVLGVLSCIQEGVELATGVFTPVSEFIVNRRVDTQRRRLNYLA